MAHPTHLAVARLHSRRELKTLVVSGGRFQPRTHALGGIESTPKRLGHFYFSVQIMIFHEFSKIEGNSWFGAHRLLIFLSAAGCCRGAGRGREEAESSLKSTTCSPPVTTLGNCKKKSAVVSKVIVVAHARPFSRRI